MILRSLLCLAAAACVFAGPLAAAATPAKAEADAQALPASVSRDQAAVVVTESMVRLGDLFTNTGDKAGLAVEAAPAAGAQTVFDVYRLAAIARAHGLIWQARSWSEKVVIERASQTVAADQVLLALRAAIEKEMAPEGRWDIDLAGHDLTLTLPMDKPAAIAIENLRMNRTSGQFAAVVTAPAGDPAAVRLNIAGRVHRMMDVPTLNRRMSAGDVIARADLSWVTMRADLVSRNVITEAERLIGMTPTRTAVAGRPLMNGEVRAPIVVAKDSLVIMILRTPQMVLTSKGRALENGASGDVIRVMNTQSKTVIEGEVTASGTVVVTAAHFLPRGIPGQTAARR